MVEEDRLHSAELALGRGELVVLPTDTVYGLAALPHNPAATARLFEAKGRPRSLTLPVLVADLEQAAAVGRLDRRARALAARLWPGALTIVVPRREDAASWDLGDERDTVGVRVPDHPTALALLRRTGPLAVTSANRSGQPTPLDCDGVRAALGGAVAVYLCGAVGGIPSTVVDLSGSEPRVLRAGAIPAADVDDVL